MADATTFDAGEQFCYLTTTGRRTGRAHEIEIWFGARGDTVYMLAGGGRRSDWVRNLLAEPAVRLQIGAREWAARARIVDDEIEDALARWLLAAKYQGWREGAPLSDWAARALPVAVDLPPEP